MQLNPAYNNYKGENATTYTLQRPHLPLTDVCECDYDQISVLQMWRTYYLLTLSSPPCTGGITMRWPEAAIPSTNDLLTGTPSNSNTTTYR